MGFINKSYLKNGACNLIDIKRKIKLYNINMKLSYTQILLKFSSIKLHFSIPTYTQMPQILLTSFLQLEFTKKILFKIKRAKNKEF